MGKVVRHLIPSLTALLVLASASGCGMRFLHQGVIGALSEPPLLSLEPGFTDDFTGSSIGAHWMLTSDPASQVGNLPVGALDPTIPISQTGGQLVFGEGTAVNVYSGHGIETQETFDFTGGSTSVDAFDIPAATAPVRYREFGLWILTPSGDGWETYYIEDRLYFTEWYANGTFDSINIPYDPVQHRYWQIRHDVDSDLIHYETSPDRETWTSRRALPRLYSLTGNRAILYTYNNNFNHGPSGQDSGAFDDFEISAGRGAIPAASSSSVRVRGKCGAEGQLVRISGAASANAVCSGGQWKASLDFSAAAAGPVTITIRHATADGSEAEPISHTFTKL